MEEASSKRWKAQMIRTYQAATAVAFNQHVPQLLAVGTSANFGFAGSGQLSIYKLPAVRSSHDACGELVQKRETTQSILDTQWSEYGTGQAVGAALGDGKIVIWNVCSNEMRHLAGHTAECSSLEWNVHSPHFLLTSSWDSSVQVWDAEQAQKLVCVPGLHQKAVYQARWCPSQASIMATAGGDGCIRILDIRCTNSTRILLVASSKSHDREVLSLDWNKFSPFLVAAAGADGVVKLWDIRRFSATDKCATPNKCLAALAGHRLAVRCVAWSPFHRNILATGSYDMSVVVWDCQTSMRHRYSHHSEFVVGISWNLFVEGVLASASWDGTIGIWDALSGCGPEKRGTALPITTQVNGE